MGRRSRRSSSSSSSSSNDDSSSSDRENENYDERGGDGEPEDAYVYVAPDNDNDNDNDNYNYNDGDNYNNNNSNSEFDSLASESYYNIVNTATGTFLDVSAYDNTKVQGYQNNGGYLNQKWIASTSGGEWFLQNARTTTYLTAPSSSGGSAVIASTWPTPWRLIPLGGGRYTVALASNPSIVLDLTESNPANETPVIVYPSYGTSNQVWEFIPTSRGNLS